MHYLQGGNLFDQAVDCTAIGTILRFPALSIDLLADLSATEIIYVRSS